MPGWASFLLEEELRFLDFFFRLALHSNYIVMDESSFFLYGMGESPEALTLGSLVLEKYWQPTLARHYTHEVLRYVPIY